MASVEELRNQIWGEVVCSGDAGWQEAIRVWAVSPIKQRTPKLVVRPRGTRDVIAAIKYAQQHSLPFAVKGGGHQSNNVSTADGGLTLDMSLMRGVIVDPEQRTATALGGSLLGDLDQECALHNLAIPLGTYPYTGMGLALAGGVGILSGLLGPSSRYIKSLTTVTADGTVREVDADKEPDLLWACRGVGTAFGVVTKIVFNLTDISNHVAGFMIWKDDKQHTALRVISKWIREVGIHTPGVALNLHLGFKPEGAFWISQVVYLATQEASVDARLQFLEPLRDLEGPEGKLLVQDTVALGGYLVAQSVLADAATVFTQPNYDYWVAGSVSWENYNDDFLDVFCGVAEKLDSSKFGRTLFAFHYWGEAMSPSANKDLPVSWAVSSEEVVWGIFVDWSDAQHNEEGVSYAKESKATLKEATQKSDVGYTNLHSELNDDDGNRAHRVGGVENVKRLRALKAKYDPDNFFKGHNFSGLF